MLEKIWKILDLGIEWSAKTRSHVAAFTRRAPLIATVLYAAVFCGISMVFVDRPLALWIKGSLNSNMFGFFKTITGFGLGGHWYTLFVFMVLRCQLLAWVSHTVEGYALWKKRLQPWLYALAVMITSGIGVTVLKFIFGRYRPKMLFSDGIYGFALFSGNNSFPSGHSQNIWAAMMALWFIVPHYRPVWIVVGVLISLSRVFTTVHFLSDVVMGSTLSIVTAIWLKRAFDNARPHDIAEWR